jgi:predicted RNA-binding protein (virulence factor B family)
MASAQTESVIGDFIGALLGVDAVETLALTTHMAGPLKDHVVRALTELNAVSVEIVDQIDDLMDAINEAMNRRNVIVHNALIMHPGTGEILSHRLKARGSLQLELRPVSVEEIKQDASLIYEVGMALMGFMMAYGLGPRERKHAPRQPLDRSKKARAKRRDTAGVTR